ncbi:YeeE/YedE family protein [Thiosocius teredinicola]|uniref:YeeE/YedE family protein n=1 Tax=Thiosocius teredinicola TaxID=1973002 RepID=UPI0009911009
MQFESFIQAESAMLWGAFAIALIMGAVVNKTNFCTMGAVSDLVNMGDTGRMRSWLFAIAVAMLGVAALEYMGLVDVTGTFPPYRAGNLIWAENILGGLMFGIGMTLASGCGNKTLIRIGGGNIKSIIVFAIIAVIAYFMISPFPGSDQTLMSLLFYDWIRPLSANLGQSQDLGYLVAGEDGAKTGRLVIGLVLGLALMAFAFKSVDFRGSFDNMLGGFVVGLAVLGAWYLTSNILVESFDGPVSLSNYYAQWDMLADSNEGKPAQGRPLASQSYTFINPMGQTLGYLAGGFERKLLNFGVMAVLGVIAGSLLWALLSRSFRIEWFSSLKDAVTHVIGAVLMGFGGTLAMGCTVGQAITGVSTLALGSILTFGAIFIGSALTMKVQYYKMVYEDEASFGKALLTGLVDLKLLPERFRRLEAV